MLSLVCTTVYRPDGMGNVLAVTPHASGFFHAHGLGGCIMHHACSEIPCVVCMLRAPQYTKVVGDPICANRRER